MALNGVVNGSLVKTINISKNKSVVDFFFERGGKKCNHFVNILVKGDGKRNFFSKRFAAYI